MALPDKRIARGHAPQATRAPLLTRLQPRLALLEQLAGLLLVLGGSILLSLTTASIATWVYRQHELDAAVELDQRFGLKERVSSSLMR